jgi:hypothetical protein
MATNLQIGINYVDADVNYQTTSADFIVMDLTSDYLIWSATLANLMTHQPTAGELNAAASIIDPVLAVTVAECLLMDYSHSVGGNYYTHLVLGMGLNKRFPFMFSFDGATATEPQLEAWDDATHTTFVKNVLGLGTANNSFVKGVCTTLIPPGSNWVGAPLAGGTNVLLLNAGTGALATLGSGITSQELYANLKIVIPANYSVAAAESFVLTCRYTYI